MLSQLLMIVIMISLDGYFLEGAVHAFDLAIGPGMIRSGQAMLRTIFQADARRYASKHACLFCGG